MRANSSQNKSGTRSPSETRIILHVLLHLSDIAEGKIILSLKSITRRWLKRCSFHCLPCEGGKPLVPQWYFGQASSISKPPVGVIIAAWNCWCRKVIRSHMVSLSPLTLMRRISHLTKGKIKYKCSRVGLAATFLMSVLFIQSGRWHKRKFSADLSVHNAKRRLFVWSLMFCPHLKDRRVMHYCKIWYWSNIKYTQGLIQILLKCSPIFLR